MVPPGPLLSALVTWVALAAICGAVIVLIVLAAEAGIGPATPTSSRVLIRAFQVSLVVVGVGVGVLTAVTLFRGNRPGVIRVSRELRTVEFEGFPRPDRWRYLPTLGIDFRPWRLPFDDIIAVQQRTLFTSRGRVDTVTLSTSATVVRLSDPNGSAELIRAADWLAEIAATNRRRPGGEARVIAAPRPLPRWAAYLLLNAAILTVTALVSWIIFSWP